MLRFFAYKRFGHQYKGNLKQFLDNAAQKLNEQWKRQSKAIIEESELLEAALSTTHAIFGDVGELRKWNGFAYEGRINRAVFDIMTYYFSDPEIAKAAIENAEAVEAAFRGLCEDDAEFLSALESTTKSLDANTVRFSAWADALNNILDTDLGTPM